MVPEQSKLKLLLLPHGTSDSLHKDLGILNIKRQIGKFATTHKKRLLNHPNESVKNLNHTPQHRRLKRNN